MNLTTKCYDLRRPIAADYEQLYALQSIIVNADGRWQFWVAILPAMRVQ